VRARLLPKLLDNAIEAAAVLTAEIINDKADLCTGWVVPGGVASEGALAGRVTEVKEFT
jgi:hypothetical protein